MALNTRCTEENRCTIELTERLSEANSILRERLPESVLQDIISRVNIPEGEYVGQTHRLEDVAGQATWIFKIEGSDVIYNLDDVIWYSNRLFHKAAARNEAAIVLLCTKYMDRFVDRYTHVPHYYLTQLRQDDIDQFISYMAEDGWIVGTNLIIEDVFAHDYSAYE